MEDMKVPQARSRISIAPSMLREKKGKGYKDISVGQAPVETTIDYPLKKGMGMSLPLKISVAQKRTLKKGGAITIKPDMIMKDAEEALALLPASAKKIMSSIVKNKGIRYALKQGEDLVNKITGKGLFEDFFTKTLPKAGSKLGKPYEQIGINPFDLGFQLGKEVIGPAIVGKGKFEDFFTKTIPRAIKGKVKEYSKKPENIMADVLDSQSPIKIPIINKNPEAMLLRGKGGKLVSTRNGCGSPYLSKPYKNTRAYKQGGSFLPAGGGSIYPAGKRGGMMGCSMGCGIDTPIQLGSPYIDANSPAMTPFIPTRGIQSSQLIR